MDTLLDYLHWIGPFSFSEVPFGEVDQLLFSVFAYVRFELLGTYSLSLREAAGRMGALDTDEEKARAESDLRLLERAASTRRFKDTWLFGCSGIFDKSLETQFFACTFLAGRDLVIAYRGTDNTLTGWKEDFNMAFTRTVPAQNEAVGYLSSVMDSIPGHMAVLTGHSKGGNLSLYAYLKAPQRIKGRIKAVYSNDGPGFNDKSLIDDIDDKVTVFVPEGSVVGMLLSHPEEYKVVKSSSFSVLQHDPHTWLLDGPRFALAETLSKESLLFDSRFNEFLDGKSDEERAVFVNTIFELVASLRLDEAHTDPSVLKETFPDVMHKITAMRREDRRVMLDFLKGLIGTLVPGFHDKLLM